MSDASDWLADHESIVGFPMPCHDDPGVEHPIVAHEHDRNVGMLDRLAELSPPPARLRASPDVAHMLVCPDRLEPSARDSGYELACDPSLPPDSVELP